MRIAIFIALLLVALGYAAWRGGAPERVMVGIAILMVLLDRLLVSTGPVEYHSVDLGYLVIDLIGSAATIALALLALRLWPMIVAVLQDRKRVVEGKSVYLRVHLGGRLNYKK